MKSIWALFLLSVNFTVFAISRQTVLEGLEKTFDFLLREPTLNIDGLFGIVQAQGILEQILSEMNETNEKHLVEKLIGKTSEIIKIILPALPNDSYKYQMFNKYITDPKLFKQNIQFTKGNLHNKNVNIKTHHNLTSLIGFARYQYYSKFSEEFSDMCIVEILEKTRDLNRRVCQVSEKCLNYMVNHKINKVDAGYGAPHKVLYLQLAKARNCVFDPVVYDKHVRYLCSYIFWEAKKMVCLGVIFHYNIDLLFEQIFVCAFEGFSEFLKDDWLKLMLLDQDPSGCFYEKLKNDRNKREANQISNGCSDHTTGLAAGTLALFYYYKTK